MSSILAGVWPEIAPWLPFAAALAIGWTGRKLAALPFLAVAAILAWQSGALGLPSILIFAACLAASAQIPRLPPGARPLGHGLLILACLAFGLGLVPGADRLTIAADFRTGPASLPFSYGIGLEKPFAFFLLLFGLPDLLARTQGPYGKLMGAALAILAGLFLLALSAGTLRWEASFPGWLPIFAVGNLLLTCLPEEAFFRGYIQRRLSARLGIWPGLALSGLLFGLAHLGGGAVLAVFAGLAGLAYGLAFQFGGGLRAAVLFHFGFNMAHLLLFTYPAAIG
ncbi:CPBP family intramembrane glutamic endopeptidase [Mangrovicoccus sp. HB161399]|uniref:CPBP family intramembrane glutamic endopeptidase n=1 Tax=Mangrovicoccus sp. HB161399 TaxID=2720392 RepID=UPI001552CB18|nr:CPBP family intramembrane glutamic endopeptidase [Mangrovicoccus sp. HB161399]